MASHARKHQQKYRSKLLNLFFHHYKKTGRFPFARNHPVYIILFSNNCYQLGNTGFGMKRSAVLEISSTIPSGISLRTPFATSSSISALNSS